MSGYDLTLLDNMLGKTHVLVGSVGLFTHCSRPVNPSWQRRGEFGRREALRIVDCYRCWRSIKVQHKYI